MKLSQPNWWDHLQDLTTPIARQWKDEFWAKAGLLRLLAQDAELAPHILPWFYIDSDSVQSGKIHELPESMKRDSWNLLYRSTHPHDWYDFIGGLPTLRDNITVEIPSWEQQERSRLSDRVGEYFVALQLSWRGNQAFVRNDGIGLPSRYRPFMINEILKRIYNWTILRSTLEMKYNKLNEKLKSTKPDMVQLKHHEMVQRILAKLQKKDWWDYLTRRNLPDPSKTTGIYVQNILHRGHTGSIVEHPNRPGVYIASYRCSGWDIHNGWLYTDLVNDQWQYIGCWHNVAGDVPEPYILRAIELYKKVRAKWLFEDGISFQMEFGTDWSGKPYIFQVRQFRPFEQADWENKKGIECLSFGITPPEWIELVCEIRHGDELILPSVEPVKKWVQWMIANTLKANVSPSFRLEDLSFFGLKGFSRPNLEHHLYEPAMRVPLVLPDSYILPPIFQDPFMQPGMPLQTHFRYFSDGIRARIECIGSEESTLPLGRVKLTPQIRWR